MGLKTLWTMQEKTTFVFNDTRVTNRAESIVVGSLIVSYSFNHELVVTYTNFPTRSFLLVEFLVKSR